MIFVMDQKYELQKSIIVMRLTESSLYINSVYINSLYIMTSVVVLCARIIGNKIECLDQV